MPRLSAKRAVAIAGQSSLLADSRLLSEWAALGPGFKAEQLDGAALLLRRLRGLGFDVVKRDVKRGKGRK